MKSTPESIPSLVPHPEAERFVGGQIDLAVEKSDWLKNFKKRLLRETGTRLFDWVDHVYCEASPTSLATLADVGFETVANGSSFRHQNAIFPRVIVRDGDSDVLLGLKVESIDDFLAIHEDDIRSKVVEGKVSAQLRLARVTFVDGTRADFVERHGYQGFVPGNHDETVTGDQVDRCLEDFWNRPRPYVDPDFGFKAASSLFRRAANTVGRNHACDLFFRTEREYWETRNLAARVQRERQSKLGLGWANHDHHTYRCSRECFAPLIHFLEEMGFQCRERFYASRDAGWGAQVLEHADCGIVVFADVDMSEEELSGDFAHEGLEPRVGYGTVGLWCKLHGDSFLAAGMHHLECQFDFEAAREQLALAGIQSMKPFTDFPHLKQAFTLGETWPVPSDRLEALVRLEVVSDEDANRFATEGAIGSHLEILERNDGYKGFNQSGISQIILQTNPRNTV